MKRHILICLILLCFLQGCGKTDDGITRTIALREALSSKRISFDTLITADYQDEIYTFKMHCETETSGRVLFEVVEPDSIKGITGYISNDNGNLTFDDQVLMFSILSEDLPSPVSAPWLFMKLLRSGYISGANADNNGYYFQVDDSYAENSLKLDVKVNNDDVPYFAEIYWQGRRIITMNVENFIIL